MSKKTADTQKIINVFITYKHNTGAVYIDKVKKLLDESIEKVSQCDGYDLILDRNVDYDYSFIDELYSITDLDIFIISDCVDESPFIQQELKAMKDRGIPVIPIRFEGYEENDIRKVINPESVDVLPLEMAYGREPDEEIIQSMANRMTRALERFDRRKRDKVSKEIMKKAKMEDNGYSISGWLVEKGKRIVRSAAEGAVEGAERFTKTSVNWLVYVLLIALLLAALGTALTWDELKEMYTKGITLFSSIIFSKYFG